MGLQLRDTRANFRVEPVRNLCPACVTSQIGRCACLFVAQIRVRTKRLQGPTHDTISVNGSDHQWRVTVAVLAIKKTVESQRVAATLFDVVI